MKCIVLQNDTSPMRDGEARRDRDRARARDRARDRGQSQSQSQRPEPEPETETETEPEPKSYVVIYDGGFDYKMTFLSGNVTFLKHFHPSL